MARSKIATVIVLDIGYLVNSAQEDGISFFKHSKQCVSNIILRKIFSGEEITVLCIGSDLTNNDLAKSGTRYQNIYIISPLQIASWDLHDKVESLKPTNIDKSNWIEGLIVALDYLNKQSASRKFTDKKVLLFTNFKSSLDFSDDNTDALAKVFCDENVQLIIVGVDLENVDGSELGSIDLINTLTEKLSQSVILTFDETNEITHYYGKKNKSVQVKNITLDIGSFIKIPVSWSKFTTENEIAETPHHKKNKEFSTDLSGSIPDGEIKEKRPAFSMVTDISKECEFGNTKVDLNYADLEAIKRPPCSACFELIGCVKQKVINPTMYIGRSVYIVRPIKKNKKSFTMLSAFVDALIGEKRVGIARRVLTTNGTTYIGALIPFSDEAEKHLYFLQLPTAEWIDGIPLSNSLIKPPDELQKKAVDDFVDSMLLPSDLMEEGNGVLIQDPSYQLECYNLTKQAKNTLPNDVESTSLPSFIENLVHPAPNIELQGEEMLNLINRLFPVLVEKDQNIRRGRKRGVNKDQQYNDAIPSTSFIKTDSKVSEEALNEEEKLHLKRIEDNLGNDITNYENKCTLELIDDL